MLALIDFLRHAAMAARVDAAAASPATVLAAGHRSMGMNCCCIRRHDYAIFAATSDDAACLS